MVTDRSKNTDLINTLEFVDEREQEYFACAQLGEQVRAFLTSPAGRYLHGRAKAQYQQAQEDALACNPDSFFGRRKLKGIQRSAEIAACFMKWCADAITDGEMAYKELQDYSD